VGSHRRKKPISSFHLARNCRQEKDGYLMGEKGEENVEREEDTTIPSILAEN